MIELCCKKILVFATRYKYRRWLEASNFGFRKQSDCTIYLYSENKGADLSIVFIYSKSGFSREGAHFQASSKSDCQSRDCWFGFKSGHILAI